MNRGPLPALAIGWLLSCAVPAQQQTHLALAPTFGDHMVLQRGRPVTVHGTATAGAAIEVTFAAATGAATAGTDGRWRATLPALAASADGRELVVRATRGDDAATATLRDVVIGDVWLCSGQSNMRWRVRQAAAASEMLEGAALPNLRLLDFEGRSYSGSGNAALDLAQLSAIDAGNYYSTTGWQRSSPATAKTFSAVAFAFGARLARELDVPIGLIHNAIGGSPIEAWLPREGDSVDAPLRQAMSAWWTDPDYPSWCRQRLRQDLAAWVEQPTAPRPHHCFEPSFLHEAGIAPLADVPLRGVLWYQGESNAEAAGGAADPARTRSGLVSLIRSVRAQWNEPDLPFLMVQLPGMNRPWAPFRAMQFEVARDLAGVGMAVTIDVGHPTDVHPRRKLPVGERLARLALAGSYGRDIVANGPMFRRFEQRGRSLRLHFDHAIGLRAVDAAPLRGFEIAGADRVLHPAQARIDGDTIVVHTAEVAAPTAARYAWADDPDGNLVNAELLPASPFRTDRWPDATRPTRPELCSFEAARVGALRALSSPIGDFAAVAGHVEISAQFAHSGRQCLHLLGGEDRQLVLTPQRRDARVLSFRAERWTRRDPFTFRIDAEQDGSWGEIYDGDAEVRVGARFLSGVRVELPPGTTRLRLRCTSPPQSGLLIDDLQLEQPAAMRVLTPMHTVWTAPALRGRVDNPIARVHVPVRGTLTPRRVTSCEVTLPATTDLADIAQVRVWHTTGAAFSATGPFGVAMPPARTLRFAGRQELQAGDNHFWVSIELAGSADMDRRVGADLIALGLDDDSTRAVLGRGSPQRIGVAVRTAGQDDCHTWRIPGLATTPAGTLIAVYDSRYRGAGDLPGDIDVGMSRSTDGGRSWQPRRVIMDTGDDPAWRYDGIGDPAVLVDRGSGTIWVAATWSHGDRSWNGSGPGLTPVETGQLMLVRSDDDGRTWSQPINVTRQVKDPAWRFVLASPGRGITLRDGTLVFPAQYRSADDSPFTGRPFSTLMWSRDRGESWHIGSGVKVDTTECQLVELGSGALMINCRDNRRGSRTVCTTRDLGKTWQTHPTSRHALPEPTCMASLIRCEHDELGPLLFFSNPATRGGRRDLTIKVSRDEGMTWPMRWHTLYDQRAGFGYSCLTRIDDEHLGVLYEGQRELYFLRLPIRELVADR